MFELLAALLRRLMTAVTSPFRMLVVQAQRLFNVNVIATKIIQPLTKNVRKLLKLKPSEKTDYVRVGSFLVFKKLLAVLVLAVCAGVFIYFTMFAAVPAAAPISLTGITTDITFSYDDLAIKDFTGVANITSYDGGIVYTGHINAGVCEGAGRLFGRDGNLVYEGAFAENRYNGPGVHYSPEGGVAYEGEFIDNLYHGEGKLYNATGSLLYSGGFAGGLYEGEGKLYDTDGLVYEGAFTAGQKHGTGTQYYTDGALYYKGEFFEGLFQGSGELYDEAGRLIYTGAMSAGEINYRSLVGATLADLEAAFTETPGLYYQEDGESCFYYEKAGVIVTADCRVRVHEWERTRENPSDGYYFLPEGSTPEPDTGGVLEEPAIMEEPFEEEADFFIPEEEYTWPEVIEVPPEEIEELPDFGEVPPDFFDGPPELFDGSVMLESDEIQEPPEVLYSWVIIDPYAPPDDDDDDDDDDESSSSSRSSSSRSSAPGSSGTPSSSSASSSSASSVPPSLSAPADDLPEFVEKTKSLYFEIDSDVWQPESELDKTKVFVKRVTVLADTTAPAPQANATPLEDSGQPGVEDCVAIDSLRLASPTAFSDVAFEIDKQNKLFGRVWSINYADRVIRKAYLVGELAYRYSYRPEDAATPAYYSIESL